MDKDLYFVSHGRHLLVCAIKQYLIICTCNRLLLNLLDGRVCECVASKHTITATVKPLQPCGGAQPNNVFSSFADNGTTNVNNQQLESASIRTQARMSWVWFDPTEPA